MPRRDTLLKAFEIFMNQWWIHEIQGVTDYFEKQTQKYSICFSVVYADIKPSDLIVTETTV